MKNVYKALKQLGDIIAAYCERVDENFDSFISTDVVGVIASILVIMMFVPLLILVFIVSMFVSFFNIKKDGEAPSSNVGG